MARRLSRRASAQAPPLAWAGPIGTIGPGRRSRSCAGGRRTGLGQRAGSSVARPPRFGRRRLAKPLQFPRVPSREPSFLSANRHSPVMHRRKRRGSLTRDRCCGPAPQWPSRHDASSSLRYHHRSRARKLTPDQEASIRALAGTKSLRALAVQFGVSHETIRTVVRERAAVCMTSRRA
jgi:hypothetical protein